MSALRTAVVGAQGRIGRFACDLLEREPGIQLVGAYGAGDDWAAALGVDKPLVALEVTRAGLGRDHALALLEAGVRPVVGTSGVSLPQTAELDERARALGLGGLVVPNFSLGSWLLQELSERAAQYFPQVEILELHHERKKDAPSGTAVETAHRIARARTSPPAPRPTPAPCEHEGVPIHSVRLPGLYAHQEVVFGAPGELVRLRHDMHGPEAFGPGILAALRYAADAVGVQRGIGAALGK